MSILLSCLFSAYARTIQLNVKMDRARASLLERQHFASRLQGIFLSAKLFPSEKKESLIVTFDNGIDPDPAFSGPVLARLFLDSQNRLILASWSQETKTRAWRSEILLSQVEDFRFYFFDQEKTAWQGNGAKERNRSPSMIRFFVKQQKEPSLCYAFFLPSPLSFVTYNTPSSI